MTLSLLTVAGSHAYGTSRPGSDTDYRGVYLEPLDRVLSLSAPPQTFDRKDPDVTLYELAHFCKLAANANPTVLEVLWSPVVHEDEMGRALRDHRQMFLSRRARKTYGGYAVAQLRKAQAGTGGTRGVAHLKREKFFLHTLRLLHAGTHLLRTGAVRVEVEDPEGLWDLARRPVDVIVREAERLLAELDAAARQSPLPEHPNERVIDAFVYNARLRAVGIAR